MSANPTCPRADRSHPVSSRRLSRLLLVAAWRCLVAARRVLAGEAAHPLALPLADGPGHRADHPVWCGQGQHCDRPDSSRTAVEWSHALMTAVKHEDGVADTYLLRMDAVKDGEHRPHERVVITSNGSFTAEQAEAFGLAILQAAAQLTGGLEGTPGGVTRALEMAATPQGPDEPFRIPPWKTQRATS